MADPDEGDATAASAQMPEPPIQLYYTNGFHVNASLADFGITFLYDGRPIMRLALSFTTAKTLASQLQIGIENFEKATAQPLLTMDDVNRGYQARAYGRSSD